MSGSISRGFERVPRTKFCEHFGGFDEHQKYQQQRYSLLKLDQIKHHVVFQSTAKCRRLVANHKQNVYPKVQRIHHSKPQNAKIDVRPLQIWARRRPVPVSHKIYYCRPDGPWHLATGRTVSYTHLTLPTKRIV